MDLNDRLRSLRSRADRLVGERDVVVETIDREANQLARHEKSSENLRKSAEIVHAATELRRQELKDKVELLVTRGVRAVYGRNDFEFGFKVKVSKGNFGIKPVLRSKFGEYDLETSIADGRGGGLADVIGFLLRVVVLAMYRPRLAQIMILDESFRHVSHEYLRGVASLLKELNRSAGIQFVIITHKPELLDAADVIYRARGEDGQTYFDLEHDMRDDIYYGHPEKDIPPRVRDESILKFVAPKRGSGAIVERGPTKPVEESQVQSPKDEVGVFQRFRQKQGFDGTPYVPDRKEAKKVEKVKRTKKVRKKKV